MAWEALHAGEEARGPIIDLGSGGGAPGLPVAILEEGRDVILVESRLRRAEILRGFVQQLGTTNVHVLAERAEVTGRGEWRERGATVLARALAPPPIALEICLPLVAPGGRAALFLNAAARREHGDALTGAAAELGGAPPAFLELPLPSEEPLVLAIVAKREPTPDRYPRSPAAMRRRPLA